MCIRDSFSCVVVAPPAGHRNVGLVFQALCPCFLLFFSFFLAFRLVLSCRTSVGTSPRYVIGLIVPANSTLVPSRIGLRPVLMYEVFCCVFISFLSFSFFLFAFFCPSISAFPRVSCVALASPAGHRNTCWGFRALCRCSLLLFFVLCLPSVWSYRAVILLVHDLDMS